MEALQSGDFQWANTATLHGHRHRGEADRPVGSGTADAFQENGELAPEFVTLRDPTSTNCGQCHGTVHESSDPLICADIMATDWNSIAHRPDLFWPAAVRFRA